MDGVADLMGAGVAVRVSATTCAVPFEQRRVDTALERPLQVGAVMLKVSGVGGAAGKQLVSAQK